MDRSSVTSAAGAIGSAQDVAQAWSAGDLPTVGKGAVDDGPFHSVEAIRHVADDRDRIAKGLNDIVVRRLFAAGLDLETALGLIGPHLAADRIHHAIAELDQAIMDIRDTIFNRAS